MDGWLVWSGLALLVLLFWRIMLLEVRNTTLALRVTLLEEDLRRLKASWGLRPVPPRRVQETTPLETYTSASRFTPDEVPTWRGPKR